MQIGQMKEDKSEFVHDNGNSPNSSTQAEDDGGLSTGAIVGIIVVVLLVVGVIVGIVVVLRGRSQHATKTNDAVDL